MDGASQTSDVKQTSRCFNIVLKSINHLTGSTRWAHSPKVLFFRSVTACWLLSKLRVTSVYYLSFSCNIVQERELCSSFISLWLIWFIGHLYAATNQSNDYDYFVPCNVYREERSLRFDDRYVHRRPLLGIFQSWISRFECWPNLYAALCVKKSLCCYCVSVSKLTTECEA